MQVSVEGLNYLVVAKSMAKPVDPGSEALWDEPQPMECILCGHQFEASKSDAFHAGRNGVPLCPLEEREPTDGSEAQPQDAFEKAMLALLETQGELALIELTQLMDHEAEHGGGVYQKVRNRCLRLADAGVVKVERKLPPKEHELSRTLVATTVIERERLGHNRIVETVKNVYHYKLVPARTQLFIAVNQEEAA